MKPHGHHYSTKKPQERIAHMSRTKRSALLFKTLLKHLMKHAQNSNLLTRISQTTYVLKIYEDRKTCDYTPGRE